MRMVVVFPLPLGPMNPKTAPSGTARERSSTAVTSPKVLVTLEISTAGIGYRVQGKPGTVSVIPANRAGITDTVPGFAWFRLGYCPWFRLWFRLALAPDWHTATAGGSGRESYP